MNILLISGSSRSDSQTSKVVKVLEQKLQNNFSEHESKVRDLHKNPLPFDVDATWEDGTDEQMQVKEFQQDLDWADAYIIASPEWDGLATPAIKNIFIHHDLRMAHKPALLVGVSASGGGAYPIAELRMNTAKNSRVLYIPEHLIIRGVKEVLNANEPNQDIESDIYYHKRANYALTLLIEYSKALQSVRSSGVIDHESFRNGM